MWKQVSGAFGSLPGQKAVVKRMIELGLCIDDDGKIKCGDVEIKEKSLAKSAHVDRRVVRATARGIGKERHLREVFRRIQPAGALLRDVAQLMGFGVIEIEADATKAGIIASATTLLAKRKISIRQVYAKDPELVEIPTLLIITEREVPGKLINEFKRIKGVTKVSIF